MNSEMIEYMDQAIQKFEDLASGKIKTFGLSTGLDCVDRINSGLIDGGYYLLTSRPSVGKTSLAGQIQNNILQKGKGVAWVNMDMPREDLYQRNQCRLAGVSLAKMRAGRLDEDEVLALEFSKENLEHLNSQYLHCENDINEICEWIKQKVAYEGVKLVVVDYIQKCTANHISSHDPVRVMNYCSGRLKELGQELNVPMLVLSQLGRIFGKKGIFLPEFLNRGVLEEYANVAMILSECPNFDYEQAGKDRKKDRAMVLDVVKNCNGGTGALELWFKPNLFCMKDAEVNWGGKDS